jgi:class 3 adenylate cyclase
VEVYSDGQSAWEAMLKEPPDLAMVDIRMPQLDGISLCRQIKQSERMGYLPVIVVTALDAEDEKLKAIEAGADDFIGKPYSSVILLTRVRSLLRNKRLHQELEARNRLLRQVLNSYVDSELADVILTDPEKHLKLGGETRNVTVLFADLRGFTSFSEDHPAEKVVETLNVVFEELTEVIFRHGGTFDKYLGDAIMAFWGAPFSQEDDVERALHAALEMQARFGEMKKNVDLLKNLMGMGVGVHTGEAIVGNIGSERVMDYTVIGDTVNIAKRLQEIARPGEILVTEETCKHVPRAQTEPMTAQQLPGRHGVVPIFGLQALPD